MVQLNIRTWWRSHRYLAVYGGMALLVMGPLLLPGYILTFDMSWTPWLASPTIGNNSAPFFYVLHLLNIIVPSQVLQKLMLVGILVLAGVGGHRLGRLWKHEPAAYVAGLLLMINPFMYTRLMAGQFLVMAGTALLPWAILSVWRLLDRPSWRRALALAGWAIAIAFTSIHTLGMVALVGAVQLTSYGWGRWRILLPACKYLAAAAGLWAGANLFWVAPLLAGTSAQAKDIAGMNLAQAQAFATSSGVGGAGLTVAAMSGFWADLYGRYVLAASTGPIFWLVMLILGGFVGAGLAVAWRRRERLGLALAAAGFLAWAIALGLATPISAAFTAFAIEQVPLYRGYREPQKWVAVLVVAYALLAAGGLAALASRLQGWRLQVLTSMALLVPLGLAPMMLWGTGGQLRSVAYPADWYDLRQQLMSTSTAGERTLLLPWHQYLTLDFAGRLVANPAPQFLGVPLISSANPELAGVPDGAGEGSPGRAVEQEVLAARFTSTQLAEPLRDLGITRIVVLKQSDWRENDWLERQTGLTLESQTGGWQLWRVEAAP